MTSVIGRQQPRYPAAPKKPAAEGRVLGVRPRVRPWPGRSRRGRSRTGRPRPVRRAARASRSSAMPCSSRPAGLAQPSPTAPSLRPAPQVRPRRAAAAGGRRRTRRVRPCGGARKAAGARGAPASGWRARPARGPRAARLRGQRPGEPAAGAGRSTSPRSGSTHSLLCGGRIHTTSPVRTRDGGNGRRTPCCAAGHPRADRPAAGRGPPRRWSCWPAGAGGAGRTPRGRRARG